MSKKEDLIKRRALLVANYIVDTNTTLRETAKVFYVSKSTIHKDVTTRLEDIDFKLFEEVKKVLQKNKDERHMRGGLATKRKYELMK